MIKLECPWYACEHNSEKENSLNVELTKLVNVLGVCQAEKVRLKHPDESTVVICCHRCESENEASLEDVIDCDTFELNEKWKSKVGHPLAYKV